MKRLLLALSTLLLAVPVSAMGMGITGSVQGSLPEGGRLGAFAVTPFGQPVAELVSIPLQGKSFSLTLPDAPPPARALVPVDNRLTWPGLIDFQKASAAVQAAELKLFTYRDLNGDAKRQENEPLKEVRAQVGKGELFIVWASAPVTVAASRSYSADLQKGWNALTVEVRGTVSVKPLDNKASVSLDISQ